MMWHRRKYAWLFVTSSILSICFSENSKASEVNQGAGQTEYLLDSPIADAVKVNPHGLIQVWGVHYNASGAQQSPLTSPSQTSGFLLRRAEFVVGETRARGLEWGLMADFSKPIADASGVVSRDAKILQDLYLGYAWSDSFRIRVGQFLTPTTLEGLTPSGDLVFPERSWIGWRLGNKRDVGISILGSLKNFSYEIAAFNGQGQNRNPGSAMRQIAGRVNYQIVREIRLGAWGSHQPQNPVPGNQDGCGFGGDATINYSAFELRSEYSRQWKFKEQSGYFVQLAYQMSSLNQLAVRYDHFSNFFDNGKSGNAAEAGFNRYFSEQKRLKWQINYRAGKELEVGDNSTFHAFTTAFQLAF